MGPIAQGQYFLKAGILSLAVVFAGVSGILPATAFAGSHRATQAKPPAKKPHAKKPKPGNKKKAYIAPVSAFAMNVETGAVLYNDRGDEPRRPASITKLVTIAVMLEEIEAGRMTLDTPIRVSANAAATAYSNVKNHHIVIPPGNSISAGKVIEGLIVRSANNLAVAAAEHIAGSELAFAARMNAMARKAGMTKSTFCNASGLPDTPHYSRQSCTVMIRKGEIKGQWTTARDMTMLAAYMIKRWPQHYHFFALGETTINGVTYNAAGSSQYPVLQQNEGIDGMKSGIINESKFNLVLSGERDGLPRIALSTFGSPTRDARNARAKRIIDEAFDVAASLLPSPFPPPQDNPRVDPADTTAKGPEPR